MPRRKAKAAAAMADEEASFRLLDDWLRIETEHTDPGFVLPDRAEIVAWSEQHAVQVLVAAGAAVWGAVIGAFCFG